VESITVANLHAGDSTGLSLFP